MTGMDNRLDIRLIGALSVADEFGAGIALPGRKDRAVLAFLAAHRTRPIARERLVELIWPDAAEGAGRASLRQSISTLRKALNRTDVLVVDRDTVALNTDLVATDVDRLERRRAGDRDPKALPFVNGEAFLDDLAGISGAFDMWRATEQSRLELLVADLTGELARQAEQAQDHTQAVAALSQLVAINPINEPAQRRYMKALIESGQVNAAIRQYRRLEVLLQEELGISPDPATRAVLADAHERRRRKDGNLPAPKSVAEAQAPNENASPPRLIVHRFRDLSHDAGDRYFAEGLSDSITAALSRVSGLIVMTGPQAVRPEDAGGAEREAFELHGSVRKAGNRVRVAARLVGQTSGRVFWAEDYDRSFEDIFAVQDDITLQITVEMRIKLSEGEKIRVLAKFTRNTEVWTRLMRADVLINTLVEEDNLEARRLLEEALEIDPDCAAAWGELADSYIGDYMMGRRLLPKAEILEQALLAAQKALEAEPGFTHAVNVISLVHAFWGEFGKAAEMAREAIAAAPRNPEIEANAAYALVMCGHADEALENIRHAIEHTPIPPMWYVTIEGLCRYMMGEYGKAVTRLEEAVRLVPDSAFARPYLVGALTETGAAKAAKRVASEIPRVQPDFSLSTWPGADFADAALRQRLTDSLVRAGLG